MDRREFLKSTLTVTAGMAGLARFAAAQSGGVDALYDHALVIDALSIENWDDAGIAAWKASGYTAIQTSLSTGNLAIAIKSLDQWKSRFQQHPEVFIHCLHAADIERAKRESKLAVMLGFQDGTIIEEDVANLDKLYQAGTRCIQLTYNARNLLGDGCTERTNAGLSDFGIQCVEKMNQLGIIVDLSHCGEQTSADGIA